MSKKGKAQTGWQRRAIAQNCGAIVHLKTLEGYWVKPKKLSLDAMQVITASQQVDLSSMDTEGKTDEQIEAMIKNAYTNNGSKKITLADKGFQTMIKIGFLNGVHSHNFDCIVDKNGDPVDIELSEEDIQKGIESKEYSISIAKWDEALYEDLCEHHETVFEIFKIVMDFNRPLDKTTSGRSEMSPSGAIKA